MKEYKITDARQNLYGIVSDVNIAYGPVRIYNSKDGNSAIIMSENDWDNIQETLYLENIPGYVDGIIKENQETDWKNAFEYKKGDKWTHIK